MNSIHCSRRRTLARRTLLKAAGVSLALPMLDAMQPALAQSALPEPPKRFVGIMTNMGILPQYFFPEEEGPNYTPSPYLDILKDHRKNLTVFSGVSLPGVDGGHAAEKSFLTVCWGPVVVRSRTVFRSIRSWPRRLAARLAFRRSR